jgi:predicted permease
MRWIAKLRTILRTTLRRRQAEDELDDELHYHVEQEVANNIGAGMTPEEARFAAQRLVGPISLYKEECRDARPLGFLEYSLRDLRYAVRTLRHTPLFTTMAIATLALGIGANTTVFTFIENILLRSLPVQDPEALVALNWGDTISMSYPNYVDLRDGNTAFSNIAAYCLAPLSISIHTRDNFRVWGYEATGNYFETLGIQPLLGRFFGPAADDKPGGHPVLVISYRLWQSRFDADPNVVGRAVKINGFPFTVIGVASPSFSGTEVAVAADYWIPLSMEPQIDPGNNWLRYRTSQNIFTIGRLKPGVSRAQAEANLDQIAKQLAGAYPDIVNPRARFHLSRPGLLGESLRGPITRFGVVLMGIAGAALLLACINLAGMLLARASDRHREIGIRLALGASRWQLMRQLMTESLLLAVCGGLLGYAIAAGACRLFSLWRLEFDLPVNTTLHPNAAVLCFTAVVALSTTFLFGLAPSLQAIRTGILSSLTSEPAFKRFRLLSIRDLLVAAQIALSVVLVISSVLVVRSLQRALTLNLGFQPEGAVSVSFDLRVKGYTQENSRRLDARLLAGISALPGIESAGIVNSLPLNLAGGDTEFIMRTDRPIPKPSERRVAFTYNISPGYLRSAGTRLLLGRDVNTRDREGGRPVALVNEALARLLFDANNPLGRHIRLHLNPADPGVEIVGIVETGKYRSLSEAPAPAVFLPIAQTGTGFTTLIVRTPLETGAATKLLRKAVLDLNPELTVFNAGSLRDQLALPLFPARIAAIVLGVFGLLAIVLAATGLFALMAYTVSRRTKEIGIRMALGARPLQVFSSVFRRTILLCAVGILIGTAITLAAGGLLSAVLYGVSPRDPATYAIALLVMLLVALLASWNPAARAIRIDPSRTLREQ